MHTPLAVICDSERCQVLSFITRARVAVRRGASRLTQRDRPNAAAPTPPLTAMRIQKVENNKLVHDFRNFRTM